MTLAKYIAMLPPPVKPFEAPIKAEWGNVEAKLGISLPQDYKEFIEEYGSGKIGNFLSIFNPFSRNKNVNLIDQLQLQRGVFMELLSFGENLPYELFPQAGGIFPFAMTDNGDVLFWLTLGEPNAWTIVVNEARGPTWQSFDMSLETFLLELFSGKQMCEIFPKSFLAVPPTFDVVHI
jgi:hypothetical protein